MALIRVYQRLVSPVLPASCRFAPTCSSYGIRAVERFGALKGGWLTLRRILACNPFGPHGYDPVPEGWPGLFAAMDRSLPFPERPEPCAEGHERGPEGA